MDQGRRRRPGTKGDDGAPGKTWNPIRARDRKTGRVGWICVPVPDEVIE